MKRTGLLMMAALMTMAVSAINVIVPCEMGLDEATESANWTITPAGATTWTIGNATWYQGKGSMYISADNGASMSYADASAQQVVASLPITLAKAGDYTISYHYKGVSEKTNDYLLVALLDAPYSGVETNMDTLVSSQWWNEQSIPANLSANQTYYLTFVWNTNGDNQVAKTSVAIDDICVAKTVTTGKSAAPRFFKSVRNSADQELTWMGYADEYQVQLFQPDTKVSYVYQGITATNYSFARKEVNEGVYTVRVRAICGADTSAWASVDNCFIYGKKHRCYDYMNTVGRELHYMPGEYDAIIGEALPTVPAEEVGAIKLDNSTLTKSYNITVNASDDVLKFYYAHVFEENYTDPLSSLFVVLSYGTIKDTIFVLNDEHVQDLQKDTTINGTTYTYKPWSMMGISLREYTGEKIKVTINQKYQDNINNKIAYSYFALGCEKSEISTPKCGDKPDSMEAPEGFFYRWYKTYVQPKAILNDDKTQRSISIDSQDTATYSVDVVSYADPARYYTVQATSLAQILYADFKLKMNVANCTNLVQVDNYSHVERVYWDAEGKEIVVDTIMDNKGNYLGMTYEWATPVIKEGSSAAFQSGFSKKDARPRVIVGEDGGYLTMKVTVKTPTGCSKTVSRTIHIDSIGEKSYSEIHYTGLALAENIADSASSDTSLVYKGKIYRAYGTYVDTLQTIVGCDSIVSLTISHFLNDTIRDTVAICQSEEGGYLWEDTLLTTTGDYAKWVKSLVYTECDSVYKMIHIDITPTLEVKLDTTVLDACQRDNIWDLAYTYISGSANTYSILWDDEAQKAGLVNQVDSAILDTLPLILEDGLLPKPGYYHAEVRFAGACDTVSIALLVKNSFTGDVIMQRWNTLLGIAAEVAEGETFTEYQWYKNGEPIEGATGSYLYVEEGLEINDSTTYSVAMKREGSSEFVASCDFAPAPYTPVIDETVKVLPTLVRPDDDVKISIDASGKSGVARLFNETGHLNASANFQDNTVISVPRIAGIYMLQVVLEDGLVETKKIIVE